MNKHDRVPNLSHTRIAVVRHKPAGHQQGIALLNAYMAKRVHGVLIGVKPGTVTVHESIFMPESNVTNQAPCIGTAFLVETGLIGRNDRDFFSILSKSSHCK